MSEGDAWEDEGYAAEDDWGQESLDADLEEDVLEPGELDDPEELEESDEDEAEARRECGATAAARAAALQGSVSRAAGAPVGTPASRAAA